ncbi:ATP-binding protein [bacterium]|nr:ATP-binding protein [bacterium]
MAKKKATVKAAGTALEMLVSQFSQPLACLRELVQNAIDAGTNQVDVSLEAEGESLRLSVSDTGEGMTEHIIETQLTRLFASSKEGDLTKVGKFGIGFVSVFALDPQAVVVDTGRQGESWRVLFKPDRTYELLRLPHTVEGTTVHLYLLRKRFELEELRKKVRQTLSFWCRHCRVQILVDGQSISQKFELDVPVQVYHEEPGARLVVGLSQRAACFYGYYNQGLTLLEGPDSPLPHITFKIDSRYFEHTLTRDNVIHNKDYDKGMALLDRVLRGKYRETLYEHLRTHRTGFELLEPLATLGMSSSEAPLYPDHQGHFYSLNELRFAQFSYQDEPDQLSEVVHDPSHRRLVLNLNEESRRWLQSQQLRVLSTEERWGLCEAREGYEELLALAGKLGKGLALRSLRPVRWLWGSPRKLLTLGPRLGLIDWEEPDGDTPLWLLDVEHPRFAQLQQLWNWNQLLAAQVLLQHFLLTLPEKERLKHNQKLAASVLEALR